MRSRPNATRLTVALLAGFLGTWMLLVPAAGADTATAVTDDGWWWRLQSGVGAPLPAPPNVGEDQLLVQSSPRGAEAIVAVKAVLLDDQVNPILTLDVADDQGGAAATLLACQVGSAWTGVHAGVWESKPSTDCDTGSVTGIRSDDGSRWTFALGSLQFNDKFDIVLVPGIASDEESPASFSLVFEAPTAASIQTTAGSAPPPPAPATTQAQTTTTTAFQPPGQGGGTPTTQAPFSPAVTPPPVVAPVQPALEAEDQGQTAVAPIVQEATLPPPADIVVDAATSRTGARIVGLLILLGAIGLGVAAFRSKDLVGTAATEETPVIGGLTRFRHERTHEPIDINA